MVSKTPLQFWIDANRCEPGFGDSLAKLLGFACVEWLRRTRGVLVSKEEAFALFVASDPLKFGGWVASPERFPDEIADFCEKSKVAALPENVQVDFPTCLDLRGVTCPGNAVRSRLVLAGLPEGFCIKIALDDGSPIENVPQALVADGHKVLHREKKEGFWEIEVVKRAPM